MKASALLSLLLVCGILHAQTTSLPPPRDHRVSLTDAEACTRQFRANMGADTVRAMYFHRAAFDFLLAQADVKGVRLYLAKNTQGVSTVVIVAVDSNGKDITTGYLGEDTFPCPPFCGVASELDK